MKARIGIVEIVDVSFDELDELVRRYGGISETAPLPTKAMVVVGGVAADRVILERFIQAASGGISTNDLGQLLGRRGKGVKPALDKWAARVALITPDSTN